MTAQLALFDNTAESTWQRNKAAHPYPHERQLPLPLVIPEYDRDLTIQDRFQLFHASNPQIAERLAEMALDLRSRGFDRYSIKALYEILRHDYSLQLGPNAEPFRLSNDFTSRYARLLMNEWSALEGFFETRELRSE